MLGAFVAASLIGCKKTESELEPTSKTIQTSPNYYEDIYDQHINAAGFGMLGLANNSSFVALVKNACDLQFDGDDNVLFKDLNDMASENEIDLESEMETSLRNLGKLDLIPLLDGVINGFEYFDTKIYLQIYIPFIENYNAEQTPRVVLNHNDDARLPSYFMQNGRLTSADVDELFAQNNLVWVISGNETVGEDGELPLHLKDSFNKTAKVSSVYIIDKKENWANGKADISYVARHVRISNCTSDAIFDPQNWIIKLDNNQLNSWRTVNNSLASFALPNPTSGLWNTFENIAILYYERDIRKKFLKTTKPLQYLNYPWCQNSYEMEYISKEQLYGVTLLFRENFHDPNSIGIENTYTNVFSASNKLSGAQFKIKAQNW